MSAGCGEAWPKFGKQRRLRLRHEMEIFQLIQSSPHSWGAACNCKLLVIWRRLHRNWPWSPWMQSQGLCLSTDLHHLSRAYPKYLNKSTVLRITHWLCNLCEFGRVLCLEKSVPTRSWSLWMQGQAFMYVTSASPEQSIWCSMYQ